MALGRTRTSRSKSRSPIPPPSPSPSAAASPRPFLPPSHYAAAAGLAYPYHDDRKDGKTPLMSSCKTEAQYPDSSCDVKPSNSTFSNSGNVNHLSTLSSRRSLLGNLPQLEAQLLPSLRDTIDRMTRQPTVSITDSNSSSFSSSVEPSHPIGESHSPSFSSSSSRTTASNALSSPQDVNPLVHPRPSPLSRGPHQNDRLLSYQSLPSTPTLSVPTIANPVTHSEKNSLPKSALRPPTPKPVQNVQTHSQGKSTVMQDDPGHKKGVLRVPSRSRTPSADVQSRVGTSVKTNKGDAPVPATNRTGRPRSRTDPNIPSAELRGSRSPLPTPSGQLSSTARSYIPRPNYSISLQRSGCSRVNRSPAFARRIDHIDKTLSDSTGEDSTSDAEENPTRKVGSAINPGAPGSNTFSMRSKYMKPALSNPPALAKKEAQLRAGLGLDLAGRTRADPFPRNFNEGSDRCEDEDFISSSLQEHRRRALAGIVRGLELGLGSVSTPEPRSDKESDYCGNQGLAISGSGDISFSRSTPARVVLDGVNMKLDPTRDDHSAGYDVALPSTIENMPVDVHGADIPRLTTAGYPVSPSILMDPQRERKLPCSDRATACSGLQAFVNYESQDDFLSYSSSDAASIIENSYAIAARERTALGIAPSASDYFTGGSEITQDGIHLPHAESDLSSTASLFSMDGEFGESGLSRGAESLFQNLTSKQIRDDSSAFQSLIQYQTERPGYDLRCLPRSARNSPVLAPVEDYGDDPSPPPIPATPGAPRDTRSYHPHNATWRALFSDSEYHALAVKYGALEMARQEALFQLRLSEDAFICRIQSTVKLFIQPLRVKDQHSWIDGVPEAVSRLFDWLEDIMNVHIQILACLQQAAPQRRSIFWDAAYQLRAMAPRLEVYQPYLVRLDGVASLIESLVKDEESDFGEFVRIQESDPLCGDYSLHSLLMEPLHRLAKYPDLFKELLSLTPKTHSDYVWTVSLLHSTEAMIRVMAEVKNREIEYHAIKGILSRVAGLPPSNQLARRDLRLLLQGEVYLINKVSPRTTQDSLTIPHGRYDQSSATNRNSALMEAIYEWDGRRHRSGSVTSSQISFRSHSSAPSTSSSDFPITPASEGFPWRQPICEMVQGSASGIMGKGHTRGRNVLRTDSDRAMEHSTATKELLHAFVFRDLLILALPRDRDGWNLLDGVGLSRILHFTESDSDGFPLLTLDLLPVNSDIVPVISANPENARVITVRLSPVQEGRLHNEASTGSHTLSEWKHAFEEGSRNTLHCMSFLSSEQGLKVHGSPAMPILPVPKSPSIQSEDLFHGRMRDAEQLEREERGWWSLRFQQVFHEVRRSGVGNVMVC